MEEQIVKLEDYIYINHNDSILNEITVPICQIYEYENKKYKIKDEHFKAIINNCLNSALDEK